MNSNVEMSINCTRQKITSKKTKDTEIYKKEKKKKNQISITASSKLKVSPNEWHS
jgi:hypothetical protein